MKNRKTSDTTLHEILPRAENPWCDPGFRLGHVGCVVTKDEVGAGRSSVKVSTYSSDTNRSLPGDREIFDLGTEDRGRDKYKEGCQRGGT